MGLAALTNIPLIVNIGDKFPTIIKNHLTNSIFKLVYGWDVLAFLMIFNSGIFAPLQMLSHGW